MEWRNLEKSKNGEACQQSRSERENAEAAEIDHESKDAGEAAAFPVLEPGGIDFDHSGRSECLQIAIDPANRDKQSKQSGERGHSENDIHYHRAGGPNQHRFFSANLIGKKTIDDLAKGIGQERDRDDVPH